MVRLTSTAGALQLQVAVCIILAYLTLDCRGECLAKKYESVSGHTACLEPSSNIMEKGVSEADKQLIVDRHNEYRSREPAANMQRIVWDDELAAIAEKWADNCQYNHDKGSQRSIPGRFSVGQNLGLGHRSWERVIFGWYNEVEKFTYDSADNVFVEIGHYTQITWATTNRVGCAYAQCSNLKRGFFNGKFWVCNYGPAGNIGNVNKPYKLMERSKCEDCPGHCNEELQLCDCGGKTCENGGTLDLQTCTCICSQPFHTPDTCSLNCSAAVDQRHCGRGFPPSYCSRFINVPNACPHMCGVCPYAGIDYIDQVRTTPQTTTTTTATTTTTTPTTTTTTATTTAPTTTSSTTTPAATAEEITTTDYTITPEEDTTYSSTTTEAFTSGTTTTAKTSTKDPAENILEELGAIDENAFSSGSETMTNEDKKLFYSAVTILNRLLVKWRINI